MSVRTTSLHRAATTLHRALARRPAIAKAYVGAAGAILRRLPGGRFKGRVLNTIQSVEWPDLAYPPRPVRLGSSTDVLLTPHLGEFDAEALFERRLGYEREMFTYLESQLHRYDAVVEIGANVGVFTLFFARMLAARTPAPGRVFAFEPSAEAFLRLRQNLRANAVANVSAFNCAVGDTTGFTKFFEPSGHLTNGSLDPQFAAIFSPEVVGRDVLVVDGALLASLVEPYERLLFKIDVEGAESLVLRALEPLIRARRPDIVLEVLPTHEDALNGIAVVNELYDRFNVTESGAEFRDRFVASGDHRDYMLRPKSRPDGASGGTSGGAAAPAPALSGTP